jgi:hypothetical protein
MGGISRQLPTSALIMVPILAHMEEGIVLLLAHLWRAAIQVGYRLA